MTPKVAVAENLALYNERDVSKCACRNNSVVGLSYLPIGCFLHPIQVISQKAVIGRSRIKIGVRRNGRRVQNGGSTAARRSFFEGLFESFHNQPIRLTLFVQKRKGDFRRKASDQDALGQP